ncbi:hypothetical protein NE857_22320 [Nocardiopsis exhalans]|uniref:DNA-binding transcriptional MerR regulator n=2 Tax=Nocardiopsis TaxID=2013 RepID=A0A840WCN0_9ACTN|nr:MULTISPECIES: DUF6879 family protein [Nocardiopsis]MBB5494759.1 DNA-binding transcriptional MerR regulator [Nocardiopsis metallicus]USY18053.1 hypothetical protein NE857_22320 [Nocardiopsis exhalans]
MNRAHEPAQVPEPLTGAPSMNPPTRRHREQDWAMVVRRAAALWETEPRDWLTPVQARAITGLGPQPLSQLADDDQVRTQRTSGGHRRYNRAHLIGYLREHGHPLTPLEGVVEHARIHGAALDRPAYHQHAAHTRRRCDLSGPIYRLDLHTHAGDDQDPAWQAWQEGDRARAQQLLKEELPALQAQHRAEQNRGLPWRRIWVVDALSTTYLEFLARAHRVKAQAGGQIRVLNPDLLRSWQVDQWPELVLYPNRLVYVLRHASTGHPEGAHHALLPDPLAQAARLQLELMWQQAGPRSLDHLLGRHSGP